MAEPNSTGGLLVILSASTLGAFFLDVGPGLVNLATSLGITWPVVFWASMGAYFGLVSAPTESRLRSNFTYVCSVFAAAELGTILSEVFFGGNEKFAGALAWGIGWGFHPLAALALRLLQECVARVPEIFQVLLARLRGSTAKAPAEGEKK